MPLGGGSIQRARGKETHIMDPRGAAGKMEIGTKRMEGKGGGIAKWRDKERKKRNVERQKKEQERCRDR